MIRIGTSFKWVRELEGGEVSPSSQGKLDASHGRTCSLPPLPSPSNSKEMTLLAFNNLDPYPS